MLTLLENNVKTNAKNVCALMESKKKDFHYRTCRRLTFVFKTRVILRSHGALDSVLYKHRAVHGWMCGLDVTRSLNLRTRH